MAIQWLTGESVRPTLVYTLKHAHTLVNTQKTSAQWAKQMDFSDG